MSLSFADYFSCHASDYAAHRPTYPQQLFSYLATLTQSHDLAWDCGTGNGQAAEEYQTIPFPLKKLTTPTFHLEQNWDLKQLVNYLNTWSAVKICEQKTGKNPLEIIIPKLQNAWGHPQQKKLIRWPLYLLVGKL